MQWKEIKQEQPNAKFSHDKPDAKAFLVTDGKGVTPAWYDGKMQMFGGSGGIYPETTHWLEIPDLPVATTERTEDTE